MKDEFISKIGIWGQRHYNYLKKHNPTIVNTMRLKGTLEQYLAGFDRDTQEMYDQMIRQYAEIEGVNEELKAVDNRGWMQRMNSIRNRVEEFILHDQVYV